MIKMMMMMMMMMMMLIRVIKLMMIMIIRAIQSATPLFKNILWFLNAANVMLAFTGTFVDSVASLKIHILKAELTKVNNNFYRRQKPIDYLLLGAKPIAFTFPK